MSSTMQCSSSFVFPKLLTRIILGLEKVLLKMPIVSFCCHINGMELIQIIFNQQSFIHYIYHCIIIIKFQFYTNGTDSPLQCMFHRDFCDSICPSSVLDSQITNSWLRAIPIATPPTVYRLFSINPWMVGMQPFILIFVITSRVSDTSCTPKPHIKFTKSEFSALPPSRQHE